MVCLTPSPQPLIYWYRRRRRKRIGTDVSRRSLTIQERVQFTTAVDCLIEKPAKYARYFPGGVVVGRYDDFVALHVNQTGQC